MEEKALKPKKKNWVTDLWHGYLSWNFKRKPNMKKYRKLPEELQGDFEIKFHLFKKERDAFVDGDITFSIDELFRLLKEDESFFKDFPPKEKQIVLSQNTTYLKMCSESEKAEFVRECIKTDGLLKQEQKEKKLEKIGKLDDEFQTKLLTEAIDEELKPSEFFKKLQYFSADVVKKVIKEHLKTVNEAKENQQDQGMFNSREKQAKLFAARQFLLNMEIKNLKVENQMEICALDEEQFIGKLSTKASQQYAKENVTKDTKWVKLMSIEAVKSWIGDNPILLKYLSLEQKKQIVSQRIEFLEFVPQTELREILEYLKGIQDVQIPDKYKVLYANVFGRDESIKTVEPFKQCIINGFNNVEYALIKYPLDLATECAEFAPNVMGQVYWCADESQQWGGNEKKTKSQVIEAIKLKVQSFGVSGMEEISKSLDDFQERKLKWQAETGYIGYKEMMLGNIAKVLLNRKVVTTLPSELIVAFMQNPNDRKLLERIIGTVYGEEARMQLEKHPNITINEINSLDIFEPVILQKFGEGTLSNMLAFDSKGSIILADLARHPAEMEKFEAFKKLFNGRADDDIFGFDNQLFMFSQHRELFANIDIGTLTQKQKDTLRLIYYDYYMMKNANPFQTLSVATLEDIDSYEENRNKMLEDSLQKSTQASDIKSAIAQRFFGMKYEKESHEMIDRESMHFEGMFEYYRLESFLTDDRTVGSELFTPQELDMLEIARIIRGIDDPNVLKEIYAELESRTDILRPIDFTEARSKIPIQYSKELVQSLLTPENARKRTENGENGIEYETTKDGYEIIKLKGAPFNVMFLPNQYRVNEEPFSRGDKDRVLRGKIVDGNAVRLGNDRAFDIPYGQYRTVYYNVPPEQVVAMRDVGVNYGTSQNEENKLNQIGGMDYTTRWGYVDEITGDYSEFSRNPEITVKIANMGIKSSSPSYGEKVELKEAIFVNGDVSDEVKRAAGGKDGKPLPIIQLHIREYWHKARQKIIIDRKKGAAVKAIEDIVEEGRE